jgi:hypothetical protein
VYSYPTAGCRSYASNICYTSVNLPEKRLISLNKVLLARECFMGVALEVFIFTAMRSMDFVNDYCLT